MKISNNFNRFFHGAVLKELFQRSNKLVFKHLKDETTGGAFTIYKYEDYDDLDDLKQLLKVLNLDYRVKDDENVSTRDINSKELCEHIEWCIYIGSWNGLSFQFIEDEFNRMIEAAR